MSLKIRVLKYLEENARYTVKNIADALGESEETIHDLIEECERDGTILGYQTIVNWDKTEREYVSAFVELKVSPGMEYGFDKVAEYISSFPEVVSVFLMSGDFDLGVMVEARSMKAISHLVFDKFASIADVKATETHFLLNKYKDKNVVFGAPEHKDESVLML